MDKTCPDCLGNMGHFTGTDGNSYLSEDRSVGAVEGTWQRCETCAGSDV